MIKRTKTLENGAVVRLRGSDIFFNRKLVKVVDGNDDKKICWFWKIVNKAQKGEAI